MSHTLGAVLMVLLARPVPGRQLEPRTLPPEIVARLHPTDLRTLFWVDPAFDRAQGFQVVPSDDRYPTENDSLPWDLKVGEAREAMDRALIRLNRQDSKFVFKSTLTYANRHCGFIAYFSELTLEGRVVSSDGRIWAAVAVDRVSMGESRQVLEGACKKIMEFLEANLLKMDVQDR